MNWLLIVMLVTIATLISSCAKPALWAEDLVSKLHCGMRVDEVRALTKKDILFEGAKDRMTHLIRDGATDVWLVFGDDGLESAEIAWATNLQTYDSSGRERLCE